MPNGPAPETARRPRWRPGIRAQLLALLLPGMAALLAFDSWTDYQALSRSVETAYDQALFEPLSALDEGVGIAPDGSIALHAPFAVEAMFASVQALHKHLQVTLVPVEPDNTAPARLLLGVGDLPPVPGDAVLAPPPSGFGSPPDARLALYNARYRSYPVRIAGLRREVVDSTGRRWRLLVQAAESTGRREDARRAWVNAEIWADVRMLAVTVLLVWLGIGWALRPLRRLRAALRRRPPHDLRPLEAGAVPHEVAPLVDAVNHHIADHRQVLEQQAIFLADASHQLRTPLAIMMAQAGYALREDDPARMRETIIAIVTQLDRSRRLSDQLLAMAHASRVAEGDGDGTAGALPTADLNSIARDVVLQYLPLARDKHIDLGWTDARGEDAQDDEAGAALVAPVAAQAAELHEALSNLLHNAVRHTPRNGSIAVAVRLEGGWAVAEVNDSGPGIPQDLRETVFERFGHRSGSEGGAGLGLAIARAYARRNGGDIVFADAAPGETFPHAGLCARLAVPLRSPPAPAPHKE
ncbi:MAG: sensor histidine kinase [Pseudomonadota bacterium]